MPAGQVELGDCDESLDGGVYGGHGEEGLGVGHEVRYALEHGSRFEDECGKGDAGEVGARSQLGDDVREDVALLRRHHGLVFVGAALFGGALARAERVLSVAEYHLCGVSFEDWG